MSYLLAMLAVVTAAGEFVALWAVLTRHAIPRSPRTFHAPLGISIPAAGVAKLALAYIVIPFTPAVLFGLHWQSWALLLGVSQAVTWWTLDAYAAYWHLRGRHRRGR